jgi:hypothetical protein
MNNITIRIGYTWDVDVRTDARWKALRDFCEGAGRQGLRQALSTQAQVITTDDDADGELDGLHAAWKSGRVPGLRVERLRASAGRFAWESIRSRIDGADILVFDYTPIIRSGKDVAVTSGNVWLELGYAYGKKNSDNVFVTHGSAKGHHDIPSDLKGLIVGHVPHEEKGDDVSLRATIAGAVKRIALERMNALELNDELESIAGDSHVTASRDLGTKQPPKKASIPKPRKKAGLTLQSRKRETP